MPFVERAHDARSSACQCCGEARGASNRSNDREKNEHNGIIFHGCRSRSTLAEPIEHDRRIDLAAHVPRCYLELDYVNSSAWLFAVFTNTATNQRDTQRVDRCRLSGEFAPRSNRLGFYACHELQSFAATQTYLLRHGNFPLKLFNSILIHCQGNRENTVRYRFFGLSCRIRCDRSSKRQDLVL